jgi:prophage regulatory protein
MVTELNEQLLTAKDVAKRLSLSKRQIFRLNSSRKLPAPIRIGGAVRWRESDIEQFIECDGNMDKFNAMKAK